MRIAAYNVENLFDRARVFEEDEATAASILADERELSDLFRRERYGEPEKQRMLQLLGRLRLLGGDEGSHVILRRIRGRLLQRSGAGAPRIVAEGHADWLGWLELRSVPVREEAMRNTGRVVIELRADILAIVEAENRPALVEFQDALLPDIAARDGLALPAGLRYEHVMLIDGNDARGIDVGLATRAGLPVGDMRSHVNDRGPDGARIFSRDCPEYEVRLPGGGRLWVLPNHFKSRFGGNDARSRERRRRQAERVAGIYRALREAGADLVAVLGDLNDTPDSAELAPLLAGTDLRDVSDHPAFTGFQYRAATGGRGIGTFDTGADRHKIDYLLLSPALWDRVTRGGLCRKGAWTASKRWDMFPTLRRPEDAASDHHAIWADLDL